MSKPVFHVFIGRSHANTLPLSSFTAARNWVFDAEQARMLNTGKTNRKAYTIVCDESAVGRVVANPVDSDEGARTTAKGIVFAVESYPVAVDEEEQRLLAVQRQARTLTREKVAADLRMQHLIALVENHREMHDAGLAVIADRADLDNTLSREDTITAARRALQALLHAGIRNEEKAERVRTALAA